MLMLKDCIKRNPENAIASYSVPNIVHTVHTLAVKDFIQYDS